MKYYFLTTALPPLAIGSKPEISFEEFHELARANLSEADLEKISDLLISIDLANVRAQWLGLEIDGRGNFSPKLLEEALLVREGLPEFLIDYLDRYDSLPERLLHFPSLYASLFASMQEKGGFIQAYYASEREIRLVLTALRVKRFRRDILRELQFEDPTDPFVAEILAQKDSSEYNPPVDFQDLKTAFNRFSDDPQELHRALLEYRFQRIEDGEPFSIDAVLAYAAKLLLVESWERSQDWEAAQTDEKLWIRK